MHTQAAAPVALEVRWAGTRVAYMAWSGGHSTPPTSDDAPPRIEVDAVFGRALGLRDGEPVRAVRADPHLHPHLHPHPFTYTSARSVRNDVRRHRSPPRSSPPSRARSRCTSSRSRRTTGRSW